MLYNIVIDKNENLVIAKVKRLQKICGSLYFIPIQNIL